MGLRDKINLEIQSRKQAFEVALSQTGSLLSYALRDGLVENILSGTQQRELYIPHNDLIAFLGSIYPMTIVQYPEKISFHNGRTKLP